MALNFPGYRYPGDVILMAVRWYVRYKLSLRDITELLVEHGIRVVARHAAPLRS